MRSPVGPPLRMSGALLINIPQLNGEYGLLKISDSGEEYTPAPGFMTSGSESGEQLLRDAKRNAQAVENEG